MTEILLEDITNMCLTELKSRIKSIKLIFSIKKKKIYFDVAIAAIT